MNRTRASAAPICRATSKIAASSSLAVAISFLGEESLHHRPISSAKNVPGIADEFNNFFLSDQEWRSPPRRIDFEAEPAAGIGPVASGS